MSEMTKTLLEMQNVSKEYNGNPVLKDVNFTLKQGEVLGLVGENGAGKSTLMNILFGMDVIQQTGGYGGKVLIDGKEVKFAADPEVVGPNAKAAVAAMKDGDVVLLENTRYRAEETKNGEAFSKDLASLCDVFVDDAFGTAHRAHCSNVGVTQFVKTSVVGYLMQKEIDFLGKAVEEPESAARIREMLCASIL